MVDIYIGQHYKVNDPKLFEDVILITDVVKSNYSSKNWISYTVIKTKGPTNQALAFSGMISNFAMDSHFHDSLIGLAVFDAQKLFNKDLKELLK